MGYSRFLAIRVVILMRRQGHIPSTLIQQDPSILLRDMVRSGRTRQAMPTQPRVFTHSTPTQQALTTQHMATARSTTTQQTLPPQPLATAPPTSPPPPLTTHHIVLH